MKSFAPGSWLGIIGGGQLGRMLALEARRMGYRTIVWTGGLEAPAVEVADKAVTGAFDDPVALAEFVAQAEVATVEFENIPVSTLEGVAGQIPLSPSPRAVSICQNREREKQFLAASGIPIAPFAVISDADSLAAGMEQMAGACVLKTASFGYDGKGQRKLEGEEEPDGVWAAFESDRAVLEGWIPFEREISVMVARDAHGKTVTYDPAENRHRHHILDVSIVPARIPDAVAEEARQIACRIAEALDYRGIMGVEFFVLPDGKLLVNEMAPRPHNSGHHTMDACVTSQFEQQLRAVCGLPLGSTELLRPVTMLNLLGDFWPAETEDPNWTRLWEDGSAFLHLYGKKAAVGRRKMGHANFLGEDSLDRAEACKAAWLDESGR